MFISRSNLRLFGFIIVAIIFGITYIFSYKEEKLLCNVAQKVCTVTRTNHLNISKDEFIINPYDVKDVIVSSYTKKERKRYRRHRYKTESVTRYVLMFEALDGSKKRIFEHAYRNQSDVQMRADEIRQKFQQGNNIIEDYR